MPTTQEENKRTVENNSGDVNNPKCLPIIATGLSTNGCVR